MKKNKLPRDMEILQWINQQKCNKGLLFSEGKCYDVGLEKVILNDGYLPKAEHIKDNRCPCKNYLNSGKCKCGIFKDK